MRLDILKALEPSLDKVFDDFYDLMLSNKDFSGYFTNPEQIMQLKEKQKTYFSSSFKLSDEELKTNYIRLGEMHYDLRLPFVDFSAAIQILQEGTIHAIYDAKLTAETLDATFHFFNLIRAYTAKGYLNKMLAQDIQDINLYLEKVSPSSEAHNALAIDRMLWLKNFIFSIQKENRNIAPNFYIEPEIIANLEVSLRENAEFMEYVQEMISRIRIDASNVFFFLETKSYNDVLPLYRELLSVYKLTLMLTNLLTTSTTNALLSGLRKDPLTGFFTKDSANKFIEKEFALADSQGYQVSLLFIDLDKFKSVNDTYGHNAGDIVLQTVSSIILSSIRATDFAFRMGGEELLILLKGAPKAVATSQAESIRAAIEAQEIEVDGAIINVTASIGVASFFRPFTLTVTEAISKADMLMYKAKESGRNMVVSD